MHRVIINIILINLLFIPIVWFTGCDDSNSFDNTKENLTIPKNEMSLPEFRALRIETPTLFHVWLQLDDYYNYEFSNERENYYSFRIRDTDAVSSSINGFLSKENTMAQQVFDATRNGERHKATLKIAFVEDGYGGSNCVRITEVISIGHWTDNEKTLDGLEENELRDPTEAEKSEAERYSNESHQKLIKNELEEALDLIDKAIKIDPQDKHFVQKMLVLDCLKKYNVMISFGEEVLQKEIIWSDDNKQWMYDKLGKAYKEVNNYEKAIYYHDKAISIANPENLSLFYLSKGDVQHKFNRYTEALESYKKSSEAKGPECQIYIAMSMFYSVLGDTEAMIQIEPLLLLYSGSLKEISHQSKHVDKIDQDLLILNRALARGEKQIDYNFPGIHKAFISMAMINIFDDFMILSGLTDTGIKTDLYYEE